MMTGVKSINVPKPLVRLGERFKEAGHELYLVGGYVRDALGGNAGKDVDATSGARPKEIKTLLGPGRSPCGRWGSVSGRSGPGSRGTT